MKINHDIIRKSSVHKKITRLCHERSIVKHLWNRFEWHYFPRLSVVKEFPIHIDIEPTSYCQLHCPMCFREHKKIEKEGMMPFELFKKIIDEIEGKVYSIKFTGRGEPLLNKAFPQFLAYLKNKSFGETALITNGQLVNEDMMHCMIDNDLDRIAFSIDGLQDTYERIRHPIRYDEMYSIVKGLYNLRVRKDKKKPIIRIQSVKMHPKDEETFLKIWDPITDDILFLFFKDYAKEAEGMPQAPYTCPLLYQRLMIHWDGTVPMCINDEYEMTILGNVEKQSIKEIWKGKKIEEARRLHQKGLRGAQFANCARCSLQRAKHDEKMLNDIFVMT